MLTEISTHAPLARCDGFTAASQQPDFISTHAPLARCDVHLVQRPGLLVVISTHAPLARCDKCGMWMQFIPADFNSRTSCEVRRIQVHNTWGQINFNSRTSCEVRPDSA